MSDRDRVAHIRHFNRVVTRRLGALDGSFLGTGVSLGKARVLYEIADGTGGVQHLRTRLDIGAGQMSRMLRALERLGLVRTSVDRDDARARVLELTREGRAKLGELERKTERGLEEWLAPLSARLRDELQSAM